MITVSEREYIEGLIKTMNVDNFNSRNRTAELYVKVFKHYLATYGSPTGNSGKSKKDNQGEI